VNLTQERAYAPIYVKLKNADMTVTS
jgi:hypothetical protein